MPYIVKSLFAFLVMLTSFRLVGTKAIAQMTNYDLAVVLILVEVISEPLVSKESTVSAYGALLLAGFYLLTAWAVLRFRLVQRILLPKPITLITRGCLERSSLARARLSVQEVLTAVRAAGYSGLQEIAWGVMEADGHISFLPRAEARPVRLPDLHLRRPDPTLPLELVVDGRIQYRVLQRIGQDAAWLAGLLKGAQVRLAEVFLLLLDDQGTLWLYLCRPTRLLRFDGRVQIAPAMFDVPFPDGS